MSQTTGAAKGTQFEYYTSMAERIEQMRSQTMTRAETDPHAAHVAHALLRARSAALFAARCDRRRHAREAKS
jgi:hypothetical protein